MDRSSRVSGAGAQQEHGSSHPSPLCAQPSLRGLSSGCTSRWHIQNGRRLWSLACPAHPSPSDFSPHALPPAALAWSSPLAGSLYPQCSFHTCLPGSLTFFRSLFNRHFPSEARPDTLFNLEPPPNSPSPLGLNFSPQPVTASNTGHIPWPL